MNLEKENKNLYKVVLSKEDWKKIFLKINHEVTIKIGALILPIIIIFFLLYEDTEQWFKKLFNYSVYVTFFVAILLFIVIPFLFLYFKSFTTVLKLFPFRDMVIDAVEKQIFLKNKMFFFKDTDSLVFYLEKKREKGKNIFKKNSENAEKEKKSSGWVYYVKKKAFLEPNSEELGEQGFRYKNDEFIIYPVEIKYLVDFNLVLGEEGILGVWRQIAELLGVGFEENIEFEEEILLKSTQNAFSAKNNKWSSINQENSSLNENGNDKKKMRDFLNLLKEKVKGKDTLGGSWRSTGIEEYLLFREELMAVRMLSTGFELRFWGKDSIFPNKEQVVNKKSVFNKLVKVTIYGLAIFITLLIFSFLTKDLDLKLLYLEGLFLFIFIIASELVDVMANMDSNIFLLRVTYLLEYSSFFMVGISMILMGLFDKSNSFFKIPIIFSGISIDIFVLLAVLNDLYNSFCPWDLNINRYLSKLVFSFKGGILEGEHGFCTYRTQWKVSISKVQGISVLKIAFSPFGTCSIFLAIKIENGYMVMPLPCLDKNKIREILFFLQEVCNTLQAV